jgi:hypothetical protein
MAFSQLPSTNLQLPTNGTKSVKAAITKIDSLNSSYLVNIDTLQIPGDSTTTAALHKVDSIRANFQSKADSLQRVYQKPINQLNETRGSLLRCCWQVTFSF